MSDEFERSLEVWTFVFTVAFVTELLMKLFANGWDQFWAVRRSSSRQKAAAHTHKHTFSQPLSQALPLPSHTTGGLECLRHLHRYRLSLRYGRNNVRASVRLRRRQRQPRIPAHTAYAACAAYDALHEVRTSHLLLASSRALLPVSHTHTHYPLLPAQVLAGPLPHLHVPAWRGPAARQHLCTTLRLHDDVLLIRHAVIRRRL